MNGKCIVSFKTSLYAALLMGMAMMKFIQMNEISLINHKIELSDFFFSGLELLGYHTKFCAFLSSSFTCWMLSS